MVDHKSASSTTTHSNGLFSRRPSFFGRRSKAHHASPSLSAARSTPTPPPPPALAPAPASAPTPAPAAVSATLTATNTTTTTTSAVANPTPAPAPAPGPTSAPTTNATANPAAATTTSATTSAEAGPPPVHSLLPTYYNSPPRASTVLKRQRSQTTRHSIASSVSDLGSQLRRSRSASLRTNNSGGTASTSSHKRTPSATFTTITRASTRDSSPDKHSGPNAPPTTSRPILSVSTFTRNRKASTDGLNDSPISAIDKPKTHFAMAVPMPVRFPPSEKTIPPSSLQSSGRALGPAAPIPIPLPNTSSPHVVFQQIHELASKRISTLDYLRKAHEGRIYWFNTLLFSKTDLTRLPSFTSRNQARRATHYLLLGFSLPNILDLHNNSAVDYLKALNAILLEFETYQSIHPADGSGPSSLSRARIPQMFKRANLNMGGKGRRSSSATGDFPTLTPSNSFTGSDSMSIDSPPNEDLLLPNESYLYLQTPSLPFEPDFFSTFATLCDVLIDCYTKMLSMLSTPESVATAGGGVPSTVGDLFTKADTRVRKILLAGVVREFEESCRAGLKSEVGGVGKVVLGGLM